MSYAKTEHSKKLRAAASVKTINKYKERGDVFLNVRIAVDEDADIVKALIDEHGGMKPAVLHLIGVYKSLHK